MPDAVPIENRPVQSLSTPTPTTNPPPNTTAPSKKFRLASELSETVTAAQVGEQMMDTPMQFSMRQIMAVAPEVTGYLHDQTRKRRVPVDTTTTTSTKTTTGSIESIPTFNVNSTQARTFYACPSGHAKATIDQQITVHALLDNGSEVNMMPRRVFERLGLPIDTDIKWSINTYNTESELEGSGPIGVCHAVPIDIGGVEVKQPVFVVEYATQDLLLGRPWE